MVFVMQIQGAFCEAETEFLYTVYINFWLCSDSEG